MIGKLVEASFAPSESFSVGVCLDVIGAARVAVVADPALVPVISATPLDRAASPIQVS